MPGPEPDGPALHSHEPPDRLSQLSVRGGVNVVCVRVAQGLAAAEIAIRPAAQRTPAEQGIHPSSIRIQFDSLPPPIKVGNAPEGMSEREMRVGAN